MISFLLESASAFIIAVIEATGYWGIFLLMALEGSFIPLPSEIILPFSGFLASQGMFSIWLIALAGALGNIVGTLFTYLIARYLGIPFLERYGKYVLVTRGDIAMAQRLFARYGTPIIFITRLLPGIRGFLPIPAGIARMRILPFVVYVFVGSYLWSLFLTYLGFLVGENWDIIGEYVQQASEVLIIALAAALAWFVWHRIRALRNS